MNSNKKFSPWLNLILCFLQKHEWPGKHRFYLWLSKTYPHKVIGHKIDKRVFFVPVGEWCFWLEKGPENYYLDEFLPFCDVLNELNRPFTFFDLGADIGVVSSLVVSHCPQVHSVIAVEPNPHSFKILKTNLEHIKQPTECLNAAVSNFDGTAKFHFNHERSNDHEGYIDEKTKGSTEVLTLDTWYSKQTSQSLHSTLVFKVDVEGQELAVFEGAADLIQNAKSCIVLLELHPEVLDRVAQTPEDLFTAAEKTASFKWYVPALGNLPVVRSTAFYKQFELKQYDVIGISQ